MQFHQNSFSVQVQTRDLTWVQVNRKPHRAYSSSLRQLMWWTTYNGAPLSPFAAVNARTVRMNETSTLSYKGKKI